MRRLNVKLALWLVGIAVFSVVGVHLLHGYQVDRNAEFLKVQAEQAREAGDVKEAIKQYNQYLRHRDDREGYQALAELVVEVAKEADATRADKFRAYNILEEAIRRHPDLDEVRASLVDYTMLMRRYADAQEHIDILHGHGNNDTELEYKSALCHFYNGEEEEARRKLCEMVGFDEASKTFVEEPPATAKEIEAFGLLAHILRNKEELDVADAVMKQLVKWNPDSSDAHLTRGRYLIGAWEIAPDETAESKEYKNQLFADSRIEFEKALELAPSDADTILAVATTAMVEKDYAKAQQLLDQALKEHPDRQDVYVRLAELALVQGNKDEANKQLLAGLKEVKDARRILEQLIEVEFQLGDLEAVRSTIGRMREVDTIPSEVIRFHEARLQLAEGNVVAATKEFEQVRPAMERLGAQHSQLVNTLLGRCYEVLGLPDRQLEVYRRLLGPYPNLLVARLGEAGALQDLGRHTEAETAVALLVSGANLFPQVQGTILRLAINQELNKPEAERNWEAVEKIAAMFYQNTARTPLQNNLLKAELLMTEGRDEEAQEILTAQRKESPKEPAVWLALCKLMLRDEKTRDRVPQLLTLAERELGDIMPLRVERIRAVARAGGENALTELKELEQGIDKYDDSEQQTLIMQLGSAYLRIGEYDEGKRCWRNVIAKDPTNLGLRQMAFELAMETKDEPGMQAVLKELGDSPYFGSENPLYKYCAAAHTLYNFNLRRREEKTPLTEQDRKQLADIRQQIEQAIAVRGEWAPLWRLRGEVDQLDGNVNAAIANYQRSLAYGRVNQATTARRLVTLLYAAKRYSEANEALKYLSGAEIPDQMRHLIGDTKLKSGDAAAALEMAKKDVEEHPENPSNLIWYGQLLANIGKADEAEQAFREATKVGAQLPLAWELLVRQLLAGRKKNDAVAVVREASESLSEDLLAMATLYQLVDDSQQAEQLYKAALAEKPNDLSVLRRVVEFNVASNQIATAMENLDQMIEKGLKSTDKDAIEQVRWARRSKAANLAKTGSYENAMQAIKLIEQNAANGQLPRIDMLSIIELLRNRNEHASRSKAIELFEKLQLTYGLSARQMFALGQLYNQEGDWPRARDMILAAINNRSDDPDIFILFASMLLERGEVEEASRFANRADELLAKSSTPISDETKRAAHTVQAQLLIKDGQKEKAAQVIEALLTRPLPQNQLFRLEIIARELEELGLYDAAERLLDEYMSQEKRGTIAMASFKGRRGQVAEAFELLGAARQNQAAIEILPVALETLRYFPKEVTGQRCQMLEEWATSAMKIEADPDRIKLLLAELYDLQGRYDDVVKLYREILTNPNSGLAQRAVAQNNLAFVLAAVDPTPEKAAESLQLIEMSIQILGPTSDLLDTRALAYLAQNQVKQAAADLRWAILDAPSIAKYYHLAKIELQAGNRDAAREALTKAQELQDDHNPFTPAERKGFEQLQKELK